MRFYHIPKCLYNLFRVFTSRTVLSNLKCFLVIDFLILLIFSLVFNLISEWLKQRLPKQKISKYEVSSGLSFPVIGHCSLNVKQKKS